VTRVGEKLDWGKLDLHGTPITSIPGTFYLDYRENGQRVRRAIGDHPIYAKVAVPSETKAGDQKRVSHAVVAAREHFCSSRFQT
jgi:hypothetical protein